jgi:hypothetical protein
MLGKAWLASVVIWSIGASMVLAEDRGSESPYLPYPQTVSLVSAEIKLSDALKQIERQTGIVVVSQLSADPLLKLNLKDRPFWEALDAVARAANAFVFSFDPVTLKQRTRDQPAPLVCYSGIFRLELKRISTSVDLSSGSGSCHASLQMAWEPGGRLFYLDQHTESFKVLDSAMNPLRVVGNGIKSEQVTEKSACEVELQLHYPPRTERKLSLVEGRFKAKGTARMQLVTFADLKPGQVVEKKNEVTVKLVSSVLKGDNWKVQLEMKHAEGWPLAESWQSWVSHDEVAVEPVAGGARLEQVGKNIDAIDGSMARITYLFAAPQGKKTEGKAADWKLSCLTPGKLFFEVPIAFSFKDVPLP